MSNLTRFFGETADSLNSQVREHGNMETWKFFMTFAIRRRTGTFGKSGCFRTTKNGTSGGKIKVLRPLLYFKHSPNIAVGLLFLEIITFKSDFG